MYERGLHGRVLVWSNAALGLARSVWSWQSVGLLRVMFYAALAACFIMVWEASSMVGARLLSTRRLCERFGFDGVPGWHCMDGLGARVLGAVGSAFSVVRGAWMTWR